MNACFAHLNRIIAEYSKSTKPDRALLWLDENFSSSDIQFPSSIKDKLLIVTNRVDHVTLLENNGLKVRFADFKLSSTERKFAAIFYRVSKERFVSHRVINKSVDALKKKGQLILVGRKEDGIKTYFDKCVKTLGLHGEINKQRDTYICTLRLDDKRSEKQLDDSDYSSLRECYSVKFKGEHYRIFAKPGVYGWKKPDAGTAFLIETIAPLIDSPSKSQRALDLGCGSGHLSLALSTFGFKKITATDNNAAAINAATRTMEENKVKASIVCSDAGNTLTDKFNLILCNPPFHKGFETDKALTEKFVNACRKLLSTHGKAYFVTNAFIGIEKEIFNAGLSGKQIANNKQFKVIKITPR